VLAALAAQIDASSRVKELDSDLAQRASTLSRAVYFDGGALHLEPLADDEMARTAQALGIDEQGRIRTAVPALSALPDAGTLTEVFGQLSHGQELVRFTADTGTGHRWSWAAAPVWNGDTVAAIVVVGGDPASGEELHNGLVAGLAAGCAGLVLLAAGVGHLLSGRAMRPAVQALEQQEQFLVEAAHELRLPLATLRMLVDTSRPASQDDVNGRLNRAARQVDRLNALVSGLLARARAEAGSVTVDLEPLRLDQLVEITIEEMPGMAEARVSVETQPTVVRGNAELLGQAVRNLVDNALRYGAGSPVRVSVSAGRLTVTDAGPGIAPARRQAALERGVGSGQGTGTGLAIVRWVAAVHGGGVELGDAEGGGLRVDLTFPESPPST
jgi:two-component system OmpR family sensor kinase